MRTFVAAAFGTFLALASASPAVSQTQGVTADEILIGSIQPLSGPAASWGIPIANGMRMAVDDVNAAGGINGRKLRVIIEDDQYDPRKTLQAGEKLIKLDRVFALVNTFGTATNLALLKLVERDQIPMVFAQSAEPKLWTPTSKLTFGFLFPNPEQGVLAVRFLMDTKKRSKIGIIYQDDDLGKGYMTGAQEELKRRGTDLVAAASIKRGEVDASSQVAKLKAAGADAIIVGTVITPAVSVIKEKTKLGWDVDLLLPSAGFTSTITKLAGEAAEGTYGMSQTPIPYPDLSPELAKWNKAYQDRFGEAPELGSLLGYQPIMLFKIGATAAGRDLTVDSLAAGLETIRDHRDFFGTVPYSVTKESHLASGGIFVFRVEKGRWTKDSDYIPLKK